MEFVTREIPQRKVTHLQAFHKDKYLRFSDVIRLWKEGSDFCDQWNQALAEVPYQAFRWELPGLTQDVLDAPFECVLIESLELCRNSDPTPFQEHFDEAAEHVTSFPNLSGGSLMIVPLPGKPESAYPHLAAFSRNAAPAQKRNLWQQVGKAFAEPIGKKPLWLSTAGAGVAWLHVRLDNRPKYYSFGPYRNVLKTNGQER